MEKRILYVEQTADGTIGGSHYCLLYLIQRLTTGLYKPVVMFYEKNALVDRVGETAETVVMQKIHFYSHNIPFIQKAVNLIKNFVFIIKCWLFLQKHKIDLIHLNNTVAGGYDTWLVAALMSGIPCITHERNFYQFDKLDLKFFRVLAKHYSKVLSVSNRIRDNLVEQGFDPEVVTTVYDGIDVEKFQKRVNKNREEVLEEFKIDNNSYLIGLVGNIREWKGQELLIDSLQILKKNVPNFVCLLIGDVAKNTDADVKFKQRLAEKIAEYGIEDMVIFTGYRSDVPDLVNALDVQINSSIEPDPFPHVILEGMALGKVVIATNLGGAVESIEDGVTGYLVSKDNSQNLAIKIEKVLLDKNSRKNMSIKASERIKMFSMERNVSEIENIYNGLL